MKMKRIPGIFVIVTGVLLFSCSHYDELQKNPKESGLEEESHLTGENCSSCHNKNNSEAAREGWWTIAGSVYKSNGQEQTNATMELWEKPNKQGKLIKMLQSDSKGNFYTNQIINFNGGCYPSIRVGSKSISMDTTQFNGGSCNGCHGVSRGKIVID
ncbi:MAG: hypothetical protein Q8M15_13675 [Bacteroidota bacterium]|nr:hypothetical protein [Bacteroidota bacterium]